MLIYFFAQVTGNPALIFRYRDWPDLALYQLPPQRQDAHTAVRRLPNPDTLTLLWMKRPQGDIKRKWGDVSTCWPLLSASLIVRFRETDKDTDQNCSHPACLWFNHQVVFQMNGCMQIFLELYWLCLFLHYYNEMFRFFKAISKLILHKHSPSSNTFVFIFAIVPTPKHWI